MELRKTISRVLGTSATSWGLFIVWQEGDLAEALLEGTTHEQCIRMRHPAPTVFVGR
jgi:hypothetical protein